MSSHPLSHSFFFFLHFRRWHEQKCESFADGQTQSTDGQDDGPQGPPTNGCVFSAINQNFSTNFFVWRHFFCSETLFSSYITVTPTIYAVVALSKIRHKWRWYTQGNEAFYWARRLPNSAFADIYRMIGLRSRYPFYYFNFIKFRFCCFRWQFDFIFRRNPGPPVHDASVPTRRGRSCEWVKKIINSQPASTIQNFYNSCFVSNTISYITLASRSNQLQQHRALY